MRERSRIVKQNQGAENGAETGRFIRLPCVTDTATMLHAVETHQRDALAARAMILYSKIGGKKAPQVLVAVVGLQRPGAEP